MSIEFNHNAVKIKNQNGEYEAMPALKGESVYDIAVRNGYIGTEDDFIKDLLSDGWVTTCARLETEKANKSEVYNKNEVLSDVTKSKYGLNTSANPDNIFDKLATANQTVKDLATGKIYQIKSKIDRFGTRSVNWLGDADLPNIAYMNRPYSWRYKNHLVVVRHEQPDSSTYRNRITMFNVDTGAVEHDSRVSGYGTKDYYAYMGGLPAFSYDDSLCMLSCQGQANGYMFDAIRKAVYLVSMHYNTFFNSANYWGYFYLYNNTSSVTFAPRGTTNGQSFTSVNLASGDFNTIVGIDGDVIYYVGLSGSTIKLSKIDLSTGATTTGIANFNAAGINSSITGIGFELAFSTNSRSYFKVNIVISGSTYYSTKLLWIDINGSSNLSEVISAERVGTSNSSDPMYETMMGCRYTNYIGTTNNVAYFITGSNNSDYHRVVAYNKTTGAISTYTSKGSTPYISSSNYSYKERVFNISETPGLIFCNRGIFDANSGKATIIVTEHFTNVGWDNSNSVMKEPNYAYVTVNNGVAYAGTITDITAVGWVDKNTLVGGRVFRTVDTIEEFTT